MGKQTGDQERKKGNRAFRICCGTYDSRGPGPELGSKDDDDDNVNELERSLRNKIYRKKYEININTRL